MGKIRDQLNQISIVDYLAKLGHKPKKDYGARLDYFSPIQEEKNRSFCVYVSTNSWYDWGRGMGGGLVQLVMVLENCDRSRAIDILLGGNFNLNRSLEPKKPNKKAIEILETRRIDDVNLINYLWARNIKPDLARLYCKEIVYFFPLGKYPNRLHTTIGFQNKKGGWELRSEGTRLSVSPKYYTEIKGSNVLYLFEGFINMLSWLYYYGHKRIKGTIIVLNGWTGVKYVDFKRFKKVYSFLDNFDKKKLNGLTAKEEVVKCINDAVVFHKDCSDTYKDFKDFNSFITNGKY